MDIRGLEAVWVEIKIKNIPILVGGSYRPPNSNNAYMRVSESFDRACNTRINDVIITGDFNFNMHSDDGKKIRKLTNQYNLTQIIREPTHFTECSSSLIDLFILRNPANFLYSGVIDPFIPDQIRYHCPILILLKFLRPKLRIRKRKILNYELADYTRYRNLLSDYDLINKLESDLNIDSNVMLINQAILDAGEKAIPNKIITVRTNSHRWINCKLED